MWHRFLFKKSAQLVTFLVLALVGLAFWQLAISEEKGIQRNSAKRLDGETFTIAHMENQVAETTRVRDHYRHNLDEIRYFREAFLKAKEERIVGISEFLEERARRHRIELKQVSYRTTRSKDGAMEIYHMDLPLVGKYRDIRVYINEIEASDMFLVITELSLEEESGREGDVRMQLSLATYFEGGPS